MPAKDDSTPWSPKQLDGFHRAAESLKLYRRAELQDEKTGVALIKQLYVDPLPSDHVLKTLMKPNTTFLVGRKGTGKSTVFQRVQAEVRQKDGYASAYVDIKTVYESSATDPMIATRLGEMTSALPRATLEKLFLYRAFLEAVILETKTQLKKRLEESLWERVKNTFSGTLEELLSELDELLDESREQRFTSILGIKQAEISSSEEASQSSSTSSKFGGTVSAAPSGSFGIDQSSATQKKSGDTSKYSDVLMRVVDIKTLIGKLRDLLQKISIRHLYIFIDDFSELPEDAMAIVVDTLLAPLNNWSEELVKFKIAAYPGRIYYGQIDVTKIDTVYLDLYELYGTTGKSDMEDKAIDFTRRLVESRVRHYANAALVDYTEPHEAELWELLFYATSGNPRNLGHVLYYLHQSHLIYGRRIGRRAVRDAARRYYEEKIEHYFRVNKFLHESFDERSSIYSLKELLELILRRAQELRSYKGSAVMRGISGQPPTSHFFVPVEYEALLSSLELNFFLTKYYEMSDRGGRKVSIFALNFGLCQKYSIEFGRPKDTREQRLYFIERVFDYTALVRSWLNKNQEIRCEHCGATVEADKLPALQLYGMACPICRQGTCVVTNLSRKYEALLKQVSPELLLPRTELGILQTLDSEQRSMKAAEIAAELDTSYQMVGKRGKLLDEKGLVRRFEVDKRRAFEITELAHQSYFAERSDALDLSGTDE